jgi:crossover junction endodeoxyribonuclease RusA
MIEIDLPYPPSINHYWRRVGYRTLISREGRRFRDRVVALLAARRVAPLVGRLAVEILLFPPDRRRRDVDNAIKSTLDSLQHGGAYLDDSQIDELHVLRREVTLGGVARVSIRRIAERPHAN